MRTVKVSMEIPGPTKHQPILRFDTEVLTDADTDPAEAGKEAGEFLMAFANGFANADIDNG